MYEPGRIVARALHDLALADKEIQSALVVELGLTSSEAAAALDAAKRDASDLAGTGS
jgi:hypothetical protein